ncbi:MAG: YebC/PmpR family DNA-binding transcriptional regulator [Acidimicrobiales bacterium]|nr:YebC/PmpR family DNA-binding transcriptional regulator [Acidimicrobiales bacterium]
MSGHSKWATIKHKKGAADAKRAKVFAKLIKQVEVAARQGGGDVDANPTLRTMYQKARDNSVPLDTIERAVKRGTGELEGVNYENIMYEGYAPHGIALMIETLSDNRNRTGSEMRSLLTKNGGSLAEPGAVSWQFERKGVLKVSKEASEDDVMMVGLDNGAEDLQDLEEIWQVICEPTDVNPLRDALEEAGIKVEESDTTMMPTNLVPIADAGDAKAILGLVELLDDHDDVQAIHSNIDLDDSILAELA